jgi:hypothetical protein
MVWDMPKINNPQEINCKPCHEGKQTRRKYLAKEYSTSKELDLVHTNLYKPMRTKSLQGDRYLMIFIDDYTRVNWITFLKENSKAFEKFNAFKELV